MRNACALGGLVLATLCASCSGKGAPPAGIAARPRVALVGWDGATWDVIDPLLAAGRLPNLTRLLSRGSRAILVAGKPILSPVAWTTLATGFPPEAHGVTGFVLPDPRDGHGVLAATFHRRRAALWQMASSAGRRVGFVGWWTTWPADAVNGYMVSDHLAYNRWGTWAPRAEGRGDRVTFPADLEQELRPLAVDPERIPIETLTAIAAFDARERREMMEAKAPVIFHAPSVFRFAYSTDASNAAFARHLLESRSQPDLFAVVFVLTDVAGHVFWHHYQPQLFPEAAGDDGRLRDALPHVYEQADRWLGEVLQRIDPATRVIVLSDHGMRATGEIPHPGHNPAGDHAPEGIFVVSGDGIPVGKELGRISSLDLAPTVLALLGAPVARDLPGRVVEEALPLATPKAWIASYGDGKDGAGIDHEDSPADEAVRERLRSLGYVR